MGRRSHREGAHSGKSAFLVFVSIVLAACVAVILAVSANCLIAVSRMSEHMQESLMSSLGDEVDAVRSQTGFSGTLFNISDELLNNETLASLGQSDSISQNPLLSDAEALLDDAIDKTSEAGGRRFFYFASSDYLVDAEAKGKNARADAPEAMGAVLDELRESGERIVGDYENHIGTENGEGYQLMVRTVAPGVYYVVWHRSFYPKEVPENFAQFEDVQMYYYDEFGGVVPCADSTTLQDAYAYDSLGEEDTGIVHFREAGCNYMGVYCTSHSRNIRLAIFFIDDAANVREMAAWAFALGVVVVIACIVFAFLTIRRAYRPVSELADKLEGMASAGVGQIAKGDAAEEKGLFRNDGAIIAAAVDSYEMSRQEQRRLLENAWFRRLLSGDNPDFLSEYEDPWIEGLQGNLYTVAVIRDESIERDGGVERIVRERIGAKFDSRFVSMFDNTVAIVSLAGSSEKEFVACLKRMQEEHADLGLSAFVGAARVAKDEIASCFDEALLTARYYLDQEMCGVVARYGDMLENCGNEKARFASVEKLARLDDCIMTLDLDRSLSAFDEVVRAMKDTGFDVVRGNACMEMLSSNVVLALEALIDSCGMDAGDVIEGDIERIRRAKSAETMRAGLAGAMKRIALFGEQVSSQELFENIKASIKASYRDPNLSAGGLARQFGISQSWVTRLFKKYNNTTFLEYLHSLRLEDASRLLAGTEFTEAEVARRVGYNSTITMIRAFKRYRGVVPSALRG